MMRTRLFGLLLSVAPIAAQEFTDEKLPEVGMKVSVFRKLSRLPIATGKDEVSPLKARFAPKDDADKINGARGIYEWSLEVMEFPKSRPALPADATPQQQEHEAELAKKRASSFKDYVTTGKDPQSQERKFVVQDREVPAKGKSVAYRYWEYMDLHAMHRGTTENWKQLWYTWGATYETPEAEVAFVASVPIQRGEKPAEKHAAWCTTMVKSAMPLTEKDASAQKGQPAKSGEAKKEGKSEPAARTESLEKARKNIAGLKGWDVFTSENYALMFSWDADKPEKRAPMEAFAKELAGKLEKMRALYLESFPAHDNMAKAYSIVRVCHNFDLFEQYSHDEHKRDGAFNPGSKELVLYKGDVPGGAATNPDSAALREGWLQFADAYFLSPRPKSVAADPNAGDRPSVETHVWFAEGFGEYFGAFTMAGGKSSYQGSRTAKLAIKTAINENRAVAVRELVSWSKDRFTGTGRPGYVAQSYAIVDMLRRGKKELGAAWDASWDKILDAYRDSMLETGVCKKAVEVAFAGVDWEKFESTFARWVKEFLK